jgi:hypothetical protein
MSASAHCVEQAGRGDRPRGAEPARKHRRHGERAPRQLPHGTQGAASEPLLGAAGRFGQRGPRLMYDLASLAIAAACLLVALSFIYLFDRV